MKIKFMGLAVGVLLPVVASANDYPTLERVDAVLTCMALKGGQNIENLYACSCELDNIAEQMNFAEYSEARTYEQYARMPADKGALFRDSDQGAQLKARLEEVRATAERDCLAAAGQVRAAKKTERTVVTEDDATAAAAPPPPEPEY